MSAVVSEFLSSL